MSSKPARRTRAMRSSTASMRWPAATISRSSRPRSRPDGSRNPDCAAPRPGCAKQNGRLSPAASENNLMRSGSDRGGDPLLQLRLRRRTDLAGGHLAALEDHQGRDRHHAVFGRGLRALVDVELDDLDLVAHRAVDLVEGGGDHAAGAAPFGPEIDDDGAVRLEHFGFEIGVGNLANGHLSTSLG
ncbi:hypothetical protein E4T56_gene8934 [Termitomyces sp. T112]|nr:hypothetical protein E4T56_gene8934 [Termitomyces sp. T112]